MLRKFMMVVGGAVLLAGCGGSSREAMMGKALGNLEEQVALLQTVTSGEAAAKALPKAKALAEEARELQASVAKLPAPSAEEQEKLKAKYRERMAAVMGGMFREGMRVAFVPGGPDVLGALRTE